jgi:molecular chaperone DnaJ
MNTIEACQLLGIEPGASDDDVAKAFRKKASELHPDRNKAEDAEIQFKKMNEAYQFLKQYGTTPRNDVSANNYNHSDDLAEELRRKMSEMFGGGIGNFFNFGMNFRQSKAVPITISFKDSILGCSTPITYVRKIRCENCKGLGKTIGKNKILCQKCAGKGKREYHGSNRELPCTTCKGQGFIGTEIPCEVCKGSCSSLKNENITVNIQPGIQHGASVSLRGAGDWVSENFFGDIQLIVSVKPEENMYLEGLDVISRIDITLLEALKGTKKKVQTIRGEKVLTLSSKIRHRDTVRVAGFGVPPHGSHVFIVNVSYPENVDKIIEVLDEGAKKEVVAEPVIEANNIEGDSSGV